MLSFCILIWTLLLQGISTGEECISRYSGRKTYCEHGCCDDSYDADSWDRWDSDSWDTDDGICCVNPVVRAIPIISGIAGTAIFTLCVSYCVCNGCCQSGSVNDTPGIVVTNSEEVVSRQRQAPPMELTVPPEAPPSYNSVVYPTYSIVAGQYSHPANQLQNTGHTKPIFVL